MEGKRIPFQVGIHNKIWKGNSPIIRGYLPTKKSGSDPLMGTSKRPISGDTEKQPGRQNAKQRALQPLDALPDSILALFPSQKPTYSKYIPDEEKGCTKGKT
jgi:hypothetical protein